MDWVLILTGRIFADPGCFFTEIKPRNQDLRKQEPYKKHYKDWTIIRFSRSSNFREHIRRWFPQR